MKKAIINVKNENDNECFKWAVTSAVFPQKKNAERLSKRMREDSEKFDWTGIEFPVSLKQISLRIRTITQSTSSVMKR